MRSKPQFATVFIASCLVAIHLADAATIHPPEGFNSGTSEGWVNGGSPAAQPMVQPNGGPDGDGDPFLLVRSNGGNGPTSIPAVFNSGADWTGDFTGISGLTVDLMNASSSGPLDLRIVLFGPNSTSNRWTSTEAVSVENNDLWQSYLFPISESEFTRVQGNSSFEDVTSNALRFMLRHDAGTPSPRGTSLSAQLGIDNIGFLPEPTLVCGDFDIDNDVDVADRTIQTQNWTGALEPGDANANKTFEQGDCDADGDVDVADQTLTIQNWTGAMAGSVAAGDLTLAVHGSELGQGGTLNLEIVPEPSAASLLLMSFVGLFVKNRSS